MKWSLSRLWKRTLIQITLLAFVLFGTMIFVKRNPKNVANIIDSIENLTGQGINNIWEEDSNILTDVAWKECSSLFGWFESCSINVKYSQQEEKANALQEQIKQKLQENMMGKTSKRDEINDTEDEEEGENNDLAVSDVDDVDGSGNVKFYGNVVKKDLYLGKNLFKKLKLVSIHTEVHTVAKHGIKVVEDVVIFNPLVNKKAIGLNAALELHLAKSQIPFKVYKQVAGTSAELITIEELNYNGWLNAGYGLWVKKGTKISSSSITDLNVLFGRQSVDPRNGWKSLLVPLSVTDIVNSKGKLETRDEMNITGTDYHQYDNEAYLFYKPRKTKKISQNLPVVKSNGKFKILQLADMHFSTGYGKCVDPWPVYRGDISHCLADMITLDFINEVLDIEQPDFVVLTGDQIFGEECPDSETALFKLMKPIVDRSIPHAAVFGNHDDEGGSLGREELMDVLQGIPYSLSEAGPENLSGVGNYVVDVPGKGKISPVVMYFLDSHTYPKGKLAGYDWIKEDQIMAVKSYHDEVEHMNPIELAFFHIPLQEYSPQGDKRQSGEFIGEQKEGVMAGAVNTGMYSTLRDIGARFVSVGHDHCNDYCMKGEGDDNKDGVWMCYGGGGGEGGYAGYGGTTRRVRLFEIDTISRDIETWTRLQDDPSLVVNQVKLS